MQQTLHGHAGIIAIVLPGPLMETPVPVPAFMWLSGCIRRLLRRDIKDQMSGPEGRNVNYGLTNRSRTYSQGGPKYDGTS